MLRNFSPLQSHTINLAASLIGTHALGPGLRAVVWVQGCPFRCAGCIAPEWQEQRTAELVYVEDLAQRILAQPVTGLTISGGEPMLQAVALASLIEQVRRQRDLDAICFTGYSWSALLGRAVVGETAIEHLLGQVDVLIDGPYIAAQDNGRGLRGSTNQVVHRLTERGKNLAYDFENAPRKLEIHIGDGQYLAAGIPPTGVLAMLDNSL